MRKKFIAFAFIAAVLGWGIYESVELFSSKSPHFVIFTVTTENGQDVINIGASDNEFFGQEVSRKYIKEAVESGELPLFFRKAWSSCEPLTDKERENLIENGVRSASIGLDPICKVIKDGKTTFILHRFATGKPCPGQRRCKPWKTDQFFVGPH